MEYVEMQIIQSDKEEYINAAAVCAMFGVAKATLYAWISSQRFPPPIRVGGARCTRWSRAELKRWADAGAPPLDQWRNRKAAV